MKKLRVIYLGWGERFELGQLADNGSAILFEYSAEARKRNLQLSPFKLPLKEQSYSGFPAHQLGLPGLISDALPDGWGALLMDRLFRKQGRKIEEVSPLDRLAFVGHNAMGALAFEPVEGESLTPADISLLQVARETQEVLTDESESLLQKLALMGGSPHGARPKVLVYYNDKTNTMSNTDDGIGLPMLVKYPAQNEHKEVCAIEAVYGKIAKACGISAARSEYFDLDGELSAFGIERFDRSQGMRVPMHTAAGAAHVDFRAPQLDYTGLLRLTGFMTKDQREVLKAFERCLFNVLFNNRDDHGKNFSFLLSKNGQWIVSPAYDLTYCLGPGGEHQMDVCGEARAPGRKQLLQLAGQNRIEKQTAEDSMERMSAVAETIPEFFEEFSIRAKTRKQIEKSVQENLSRMTK